MKVNNFMLSYPPYLQHTHMDDMDNNFIILFFQIVYRIKYQNKKGKSIFFTEIIYYEIGAAMSTIMFLICVFIFPGLKTS